MVSAGLFKFNGTRCILFKVHLPNRAWLTYTWCNSIECLPSDRSKAVMLLAENAGTYGITPPPDSTENIYLHGLSMVAVDALLLLGKYESAGIIDSNVLTRVVLGTLLFSRWCDRCNMKDTVVKLDSDRAIVIQGTICGAHWNATIGSKPREKAVYFYIVNKDEGYSYHLKFKYKYENDLFNNAYHSALITEFVHLIEATMRGSCFQTSGLTLGTHGAKASLSVSTVAKNTRRG